jgi:hypothetical protein
MSAKQLGSTGRFARQYNNPRLADVTVLFTTPGVCSSHHRLSCMLVLEHCEIAFLHMMSCSYFDVAAESMQSFKASAQPDTAKRAALDVLASSQQPTRVATADGHIPVSNSHAVHGATQDAVTGGSQQLRPWRSSAGACRPNQPRSPKEAQLQTPQGRQTRARSDRYSFRSGAQQEEGQVQQAASHQEATLAGSNRSKGLEVGQAAQSDTPTTQQREPYLLPPQAETGRGVRQLTPGSD